MIGVVPAAPYIAGVLAAGGLGVWASRDRTLVRRWCVWAVTAPVVAAAFYVGDPGVATLVAGLGLLAALEYGRMSGLGTVERGIAAATAVGVPLVVWLAPEHAWRVLLVGALAAVLVPVMSGDGDNGTRRACATVFGLAWVGGLSALVALGPAGFPLCVAVAVADVGAWCGGRFLPGPALSRLSPNKSWGGAVGGALAGTAVLGLFGALSPATVLAVAVAAPLGDLTESMVKRGAGVKDTGTCLPGMGGVLDRIDSLLLAAPVAVVLS